MELSDGQRKKMGDAFRDAAGASIAAERLHLQAVELQPGQIIGKCRVERELGRGGMGAVYLARHTTLDCPVAIKILPPQVASRNPDYAERFLREARMAARLKHPNVMAVMDADKDPATGLYYIVQEFVDGGSIKDRLDKGPLPEEKALAVVGGVAKALVAASAQGIIHRDIKPDNILLSREGRVKLADLGLAKKMGEEDGGITQSSSAIGTPYYMSPEQIRDAKHVDARSDIYSLGATFFHLLTGAPPYPGSDVYGVLHKVITEPVPDPRESHPEISESAARLCMKMMDKDAGRRHQTPTELLTDLAQRGVVAPGGVPGAGGTSVFRSPKSWTDELTRRAPLLIAGCCVVLVGLMVRLLFKADSDTVKPGPVAQVEPEKPPVVPPVDDTPKKPEPEKPFVVAQIDKPTEPEPEPAKPVDPEPEPAKPVEPEPEPAKPVEPEPEKPVDPVPPPVEPDPQPLKPVDPRPEPRKDKFTLADGILGAWSFEREAFVAGRGSDKSIMDTTGSELRGQTHGGATAAKGIVGDCMVFSRDGHFVSLPGVEQKSISVLFKPDSDRQVAFFDNGSQARLQGFILGIYRPSNQFTHWPKEGEGLLLGLWGVDVFVPLKGITKNWHHVVLSIDGDEVQILLDGKFLPGYVGINGDEPQKVRQQPLVLPGASNHRSRQTAVGRGLTDVLGTTFFRGGLDELALWDRPLTRIEMEQLWKDYAKNKKSYCDAIGKFKAEAEKQK